MSTSTLETFASATTATSQVLLAEAAAYQAEQAQAREEVLGNILAIWATLNARDAIQSWTSGIGERIYVLLSIMQELVASDAIDFVYRILRVQGMRPTGPRPNPLAFAGIASDNRSLETLLAGSVINVRQAQRAGESDPEAMQRGENYLRLVTTTQIADAARAAESVTLTTAAPVRDEGLPTPDRPAPPPARRRPDRRQQEVTLGWVRMLNPPSCGRCALLAGRFYKWSDGFERHEMCDCRHIPVTEQVGGDLTTDPMLYFESLTETEQNYYFGKAVAQAIRDGGDINQVVNAATRPNAMYVLTTPTGDRRRYTMTGTTKRGYYGRGKGKARRPTPWQIYHDARGDVDAAREQLARFGYIVQ